jgi:hypothetical protein
MIKPERQMSFFMMRMFLNLTKKQFCIRLLGLDAIENTLSISEKVIASTKMNPEHRQSFIEQFNLLMDNYYKIEDE